MYVPFRRIDTGEPSDEQENNTSDVNDKIVMKTRVGMFKNLDF